MVAIALRTNGSITNTVDGRSETFIPKFGASMIAPMGADWSSFGQSSFEYAMILVPKDTLAFAAGERSNPGASLVEQRNYEDPGLLRLCFLLSQQISEDFVDDPIAWYELTDAFVQRLVDRHMTQKPVPFRGRLDAQTLARVIECIHANIDRPLGVDEIADAAQQSWSHFPRLFRRSVGLSPHQYVVKVRLERAIALLRSSNLPLAEVAVRVGFADQSHLCRWVRRMYGATPLQFLRGLR